jgi:quercetin dioxygenase-like cupin family protein
MAIDLYKGFSNPIAGESFRCISFSEQAFVFEFVMQPGGAVPFEHIHLHQDEIFTVVSGEIRILVDGLETIGRRGDKIVVPKGRAHIAFNNQPEVLTCMVEYRPGFDTYTFFQCFAGLTIDKDYDEKGQINIPKMLYFTRLMNTKCIARPTSIPVPLFRLAIEFFYLVGTLAGWKKAFRRYTS